MKEIKFRAWDRATGTMIDDYVHVGQFGELYVRSFHDSAYSDKSCPDLILMQYTGLKDKKGVGIFEGDIVRMNVCRDRSDSYPDDDLACDSDYVGPVRLLPSVGACIVNPVKFDNLDVGPPKKCNARIVVRGYRTEVIGSIYENPELIKEGAA